MMANQSYEQKIGLLTNTAYGSQPIPTLLGNDGTTVNNYTNDHPVGTNATLVNKYGTVIQGAGQGITFADWPQGSRSPLELRMATLSATTAIRPWPRESGRTPTALTLRANPTCFARPATTSMS